MCLLLLLGPPSLARRLGEAQVGASPGGDGLGMARFFFFLALLLLLGGWGRLRWGPLPVETVKAWPGSQEFNSFSRSLP